MNTPPILYHYCGINAFRGILEQQRFWLSSYAYMNDGLEYIYAREIIAPFLHDVIQKKSFGAKNRRQAEYTFNSLDKYIPAVSPHKAFGICFSEEGDMLGQWRAYASNGYGYAIGLHPERLRLPICSFSIDFQRMDLPVGFYRVIYDMNKQKEMAKHATDQLQKYVAENNNDYRAQHAVIKIVESLAPVLKHPSFADEREWRIVFASRDIVFGWNENESTKPEYDGRVIKFRTTSRGLVPYFESKIFDKTAVKEVWLGPSHTNAADMISTSWYLRSLNYPFEVDVLSSSSPYKIN